MDSVRVIKRPLLTEKSTKQQNAERNVVAFEVRRDANKVQIKHAVEKLFEVKVQQVRTSVMPSKVKRLGRSVGIRNAWKKATVTLAQGQQIDFFEEV